MTDSNRYTLQTNIINESCNSNCSDSPQRRRVSSII